MREILVCKIVHFDTNFFISIMFELGCTKFRIFQEASVDPFEMLLDASLFQNMRLMIFFLFWSFPISVAMRSSLLDDVVWNWEKVQCILDDASIGFTFFQEMPACAIDDAFTPIWYTFFALRLRVRLEQFKQLHVAHVLNHFLWRRTEWVVGFFFVVDLVEEIVGEGGSRSSWQVHEHDSSQLVSQQNVAIRVFWSRCQPRLTLIARDLHHGKQRVSPFYHDLFHLQRWSLCFHESNVFGKLLARDLCHGKQRVSPFYHDLGLDLVGLIGNFWIVAQLLLLVVEQLRNPILSSSHVSRKSLEEDEVTHILSRLWLLQFPSEQLSEYNKLWVFREEW